MSTQERLNKFWCSTIWEVRAAHIESIDKFCCKSCEMTAEYGASILRNMLEEEYLTRPSQSYMSMQVDINEKMRGILVDWIIEVHLRFKLKPETLFLTVNIIDRYLEKT